MSALLLVFSQPGPDLPEDQFHDWYDGEHVPLRLPLPDIQTAIRLKATDRVTPTWGAIYDIKDMSLFTKPEYGRLRTERSEREQGVIDRLDVMDRRIYKLVSAKAADAFEKDGWAGKERTFIFVSFTPSNTIAGAEEEFNKWYEEEHIGMLSKVPGWLRTRRYEMVEQGGTKEAPPRLLAVHEYVDEKGLGGEEFKKATSTEWREKVMKMMDHTRERRVFETWKVWK